MKTATRRTTILATIGLAVGLAVSAQPAKAGACSDIPLPAGHFYGVSGAGSHNGTNQSAAQDATDQVMIKRIQRAINAGTSPDVPVDGLFGPQSKAGTIRFQSYLQQRAWAEDLPSKVAVDGEYGKWTYYEAWNYGFGGFQCGAV